MQGGTNAQSLKSPYIRLMNLSSNISANVLTVAKYTSSSIDTDYFEYNSTTGVITVKKDGAYLVTMSIACQIANAGIVQIGFKWNTSSQYYYAHHYQEETTNNFTYQTTKIDQLSANDTITPEMWASQTLTKSDAGRGNYFSMIYMGIKAGGGRKLSRLLRLLRRRGA